MTWTIRLVGAAGLGVRVVRPDWDHYWMGLAQAAAMRASCPRASVGAVAVDPGRCLIVSGYNGAPSGQPHCLDVGCDLRERYGRESCHRARHAEANLIRWATQHGRSLDGATVYVTHQPCRDCAHLLVMARVSRVIYLGDYPDPESEVYMTRNRVVLRRLDAQG